MSNRGSCFGAPTAVLNKGCDNDFRIPIRSEADEPRVVLKGLPLQIRLLAHNLCRPCLASDVKSFDLSAEARPSRLMNDSPHCRRDDIYCRLVNWILFFNDLRCRQAQFLEFCWIDEMGLPQPAAGGQSTHGPRSLQRGDADVSLADCDGNRLARIPLGFINPTLPVFRRNQPCILIGKIDTGLSAKSHHRGVLINSADLEIIANVVKEDVT